MRKAASFYFSLAYLVPIEHIEKELAKIFPQVVHI